MCEWHPPRRPPSLAAELSELYRRPTLRPGEPPPQFWPKPEAVNRSSNREDASPMTDNPDYSLACASPPPARSRTCPSTPPTTGTHHAFAGRRERRGVPAHTRHVRPLPRCPGPGELPARQRGDGAGTSEWLSGRAQNTPRKPLRATDTPAPVCDCLHGHQGLAEPTTTCSAVRPRSGCFSRPGDGTRRLGRSPGTGFLRGHPPSARRGSFWVQLARRPETP